MELLGKYGREDLAILYVAKNGEKIVEFVESLQPPIPREEKWVLVVSTMYGCPIGCLMCDAGEYYEGDLSKEDILEQIDFMVSKRFPNREIPIKKFKIQFARMGEPSLNEEVLSVIEELTYKYNAPGLMPCISTIGPKDSEGFMNKLITIKDKYYKNGRFQLQFSIHSTNEEKRRKWMSKDIWTLEEIALFGEKWYKSGDRKITLNFAVAEDSEIDPDLMRKVFNPSKYWIKLTPLNPTTKVINNKLKTGITEKNTDCFPLVQQFRKKGFNAEISIGEWEENEIGTNCGQFATKYKNGEVGIKDSYTTPEYRIID